MKRFLICLLIPLTSVAAIPNDWVLMESFGVEEAYKHKKEPSSILTVVKKDDNNNFKLNSFKLDVYLKALPETRQYMNKLVGITKWEITSFEKKEFFNGSDRILLVKLKGRYWRNEKSEIEFEEWHHFYGTSFLQLQLIRDKDELSNNDSTVLTELQSKWL